MLVALTSGWASEPGPGSAPVPTQEGAKPGDGLATAEELTRRPFLADPVLSPSGKQVAARFWKEGREVLGVYGLASQDPGPMKGFPLKPTQNLVWYQWASDRHLLVSVSHNWAVQETHFWGPRLYLYAPDTGELRPVLAEDAPIGGDDVIYIAPDGSHFLLASATSGSQPAVYRVEIPAGAFTVVVPARKEIATWTADAAGRVRLGIGYQQAGLQVVYRQPEEQDFRQFPPIRLRQINGEVRRVGFAEDGTAYMVTNAITGRYGLYRFDPLQSAIGSSLFEHPRVDIGELILGPGQRVMGVTYEDERPGIYWLDDGIQAIQDEVDNALPNRTNIFVSVNRDASRFIVWTGTGADPGHYYLYQIDQGLLSRIASPREWLRGKNLADVRPVSFRARDGLTIPAYLTLPHNPGPGRLPAIVVPPSNPLQRASWAFDPWIQFLASRGYAVLQPNVRGLPGYGLEFRQKGAGEFARGMQTDLVDGVRWLTESGLVDPRRVCIVGTDMGGYSALRGVLEHPDVYRCAASFSATSDIESMLHIAQLSIPRSRYVALRTFLIGDQSPADIRISPRRLAAGLQRPLLVVHGEADAMAGFTRGPEIQKALQKTGGLGEFHAVPGLSFDPAVPATLERAMTMVEDFLQRHNPADRPAAPTSPPAPSPVRWPPGDSSPAATRSRATGPTPAP